MKTRIFLILLATAAAQAQTTFTQIADGDIVNDLGTFTRPVWGDFNNDGFLDLFVSNFEGRTNVFYRNNGNGSFTKITQGDPVQDAGYHAGSAAGDYDNDGQLDLVVLAGGGGGTPTAGPIALYHNKGDGTFARASGGIVTNQLGFFDACSWADYDNDGFLDLFVTDQGSSSSTGGKNLLFHNNGDGAFTKITSGAIVNDVGVGHAALWADYDNDGFMDLVVLNLLDNGRPFLYHNNRDGTFTRVLTNSVGTDSSPSGGGAWGDYDNDGSPDLFVIGATNRLYHNDGNGTFTRVVSGPLLEAPPGGSSVGCGWGDYDNDGYLDLFVSSGEAQNRLFHNNGNATFTQVDSEPAIDAGGRGIYCLSVAWVDYDNDGSLDLFITRGIFDGSSLVSNALYRNNSNTNAWLEVKLAGTVSNRSAIGAKVRVRATIGGKTFWQLREINNGGGFNIQPLIAHFGLGNATSIETVRIEWPSGIMQEFHDVPAKRILAITEPSRLVASTSNNLPQFSLKGGRGLQYEIQSSTDLTAWSLLGKVSVTNVIGSALLIDTGAPGPSQRFYRAVQSQ